MAINLTINARGDIGDKFQTVFFTITRNGKTLKFSHGAVPSELDTNIKIKNWLMAHKDNLVELIQGKIKAKTYRNEHPRWVTLEAEIDAITNVDDAKTFLRKIVRHIK